MKLNKGKRVFSGLPRTGWVFLAITLPVLLAAWNTGTNLLYLVVGGLAAFLVLSWFLAAWSGRGLWAAREAPRAVHRGETFRVHVRVENRKLLAPSIGLSLESAAHKGQRLAYIMKLPARTAAALSYEASYPRRGVYRLPPADLVTGFPFGILERRRRYKDNIEIVVYPRVRPARTTVFDRATGARYSTQAPSSDGDEFFGLREYVRGDDLRLIAWRVSARKGTWIVRELAKENTKNTVFALDTRWVADLEDFDESFEEAIELVASLSITLLKRYFNVSIITPDARLEGGEGTVYERRILEMLARLNPVPPEDHGDFESRVLTQEMQNATVVFISPDPRAWGGRTGMGALRVLDPREVLYA